MSDAVKLARDCVERWDDVNAPASDVAVTLARAVIEQDELLRNDEQQIAALKAALREALDAIDGGREPIAMSDARIAELRRLL